MVYGRDRRSIGLLVQSSGTGAKAQITRAESSTGEVGEAVRISISSYGHTEHGYNLTVPAAEKDWLLLNLLAEYWDSAQPTPEALRGWLDKRQITYEDTLDSSGPE